MHWLTTDLTLQGGSLELNGKTPLELGVTCWRTLVTYVPQTRVHPPGTPAEFYFSVQVPTQPGLNRSNVWSNSCSPIPGQLQ